VCILTTLQFVFARLIFAKHRACKLQENLDGHRSPARLHYDSVMEWKNQPSWLYLLNQTKLNQTHVHVHVPSRLALPSQLLVNRPTHGHVRCLHHACHLYPQNQMMMTPVHWTGIELTLPPKIKSAHQLTKSPSQP
jgi:hypothetical protein